MTASAWLAGVTVGATSGFLALELPPAGWLIAVAFLVGAVRTGRRLAALGGELAGFGGTWLVLLGRVALECAVPRSGFACSAPGIEAWLLLAGALLSGGLVLTVAAVRRSTSAR